jgi:signal transduction histidine kinase/CheY-like chemotaxis protein
MLEVPKSTRRIIFSIGLVGFLTSIFLAIFSFYTISERTRALSLNMVEVRENLFKERLEHEQKYLELQTSKRLDTGSNVKVQLNEINKHFKDPYLIGQIWVPANTIKHNQILDPEIIFKDFSAKNLTNIFRQISIAISQGPWDQYQALTYPSFYIDEKGNRHPLLLMMMPMERSQSLGSDGYIVNILDPAQIFSSPTRLESEKSPSLASEKRLIDANQLVEEDLLKVDVLAVEPSNPPVRLFQSEDDRNILFKDRRITSEEKEFKLNNLVLRIHLTRVILFNRVNISFAIFFAFMTLTVLFIFLVLRGLRLQSESQFRRNAERDARERKDFFDSLAHELRTPLNGILGMINLLIDTPLNHEQKHYADTLKLSTHSLRLMVDQTLTLSRINTFEIELVEEIFTFNHIINEVIDNLGPLAVLKKITLDYRLSPELNDLAVLGDELRLKQVLINLVGNAIKFTESGYVYLEIKLKEAFSSTAALDVVFSVTDTGIGIPSTDRAKLFKKFSRIKNNKSIAAGEGGLGLQISQKIVRKMGGLIEFVSEVNEGSTFFFNCTFNIKNTDELTPIRDLSALFFVFFTKKDCPELLEFANFLRQQGAKAHVLYRPQDIKRFFSKMSLWKAIPDIIYLNEELQTNTNLINSLDVPNLIPTEFTNRVIYFHETVDSSKRTQIFSQGLRHTYLKPFHQERLLKRSLEIINNNQQVSSKLTVGQGVGKDDQTHQENLFDPNLRILIAEDNLVSLEIISKMVIALGHTCSLAKNGAEVFEQLSKSTFDIILMDINMPDMSGFEVTQKIRAMDAPLNEIIIIAVSANLGEALKKDARDAGMNGYLSKPVELKELEQKITEVFLFSPEF